MSKIAPEVIERAKRVKLLIMDCDGVLTDGSLHYGQDGVNGFEAAKVFHIHDGQGIRLAHQAGLKLAIISGRNSPALAYRAAELNVDHLHQGVTEKLTVYDQIKLAEKLTDEQVAYIGDDLPDLAPMLCSGLSVAVADAVVDVLSCAHFVTNKPGGRGAVREVIELILRSQKLWDRVIERFR